MKELKEQVRVVKERGERMRKEQEKEEAKLREREQEYYVVDRLGMVVVLQKYLEGKSKSNRKAEEFEEVKRYWNNREEFGMEPSEQVMSTIHSNMSPRDQQRMNLSLSTSMMTPSKETKTKFELMEERLLKLKQYHRYYSHNYHLLARFPFNFE